MLSLVRIYNYSHNLNVNCNLIRTFAVIQISLFKAATLIEDVC